MVLVRLYATLRMRAGDKSVEVALPPTGAVRDLLRHLEELRPGLAGRVLDEVGEVRRYVAVFINGREIQFLDGLDTLVGAADEVDVFPAVAGGGMPGLRVGAGRPRGFEDTVRLYEVRWRDER